MAAMALSYSARLRLHLLLFGEVFADFAGFGHQRLGVNPASLNVIQASRPAIIFSTVRLDERDAQFHAFVDKEKREQVEAVGKHGGFFGFGTLLAKSLFGAAAFAVVL
jgi:hypothetical protein